MSSKREDKKFPKENYNKVTDAYQEIKGVEVKGKEFSPLQQTIKTMFLSEREPEDIIGCMKWLEKSKEGWTRNWTLNTVKMKMPEYAGQVKKTQKQEAAEENFPTLKDIKSFGKHYRGWLNKHSQYKGRWAFENYLHYLGIILLKKGGQYGIIRPTRYEKAQEVWEKWKEWRDKQELVKQMSDSHNDDK